MDIWEATDFFIGHICNRGRLENMKSLRFEEMFVQVRNAGTGFVREVIVSFSDVMCFSFLFFSDVLSLSFANTITRSMKMIIQG